jgi:hypothetical protein
MGLAQPLAARRGPRACQRPVPRSPATCFTQPDRASVVTGESGTSRSAAARKSALLVCGIRPCNRTGPTGGIGRMGKTRAVSDG